jgi:hypothetical protein
MIMGYLGFAREVYGKSSKLRRRYSTLGWAIREIHTRAGIGWKLKKNEFPAGAERSNPLHKE